MFHGITYSPVNVSWPGWLFYAGFHLGSFNPMWRQGSKMCNYITNCQRFTIRKALRRHTRLLSNSRPMVTTNKKQIGTISQNTPTGVKMQEADAPTGSKLWHMGFDFAWVSDLLLDSIHVTNECFVAPGATYKALVIAGLSFVTRDHSRTHI